MPTAALIVAAVAIVAIVLVTARFYSAQRTRQRAETDQRSQQIRERYGPEYDRTVAEKGDVRRAESELEGREKRVTGFHIKPLGLLNTAHFYDHFLAFLDHATTRTLIKPKHRAMLLTAEEPGELLTKITTKVVVTGSTRNKLRRQLV